MKKKFTTTLDDKLIKRLKIDAVENNTTVADILEHLIRQYLLEENAK
ncbi:hypothetical protein ABTQ33_10840 [Paucilactobacillus suebicus]|nr:hypothetical protein [Paucilactobacillus suebicus]